MISISLSGVANINKLLANLNGIDRFVEMWMKSGEVDSIMQKSFLENFRKEGRPSRWEELSEETIKSRDYLGYDDGPILQRSGKLMDSVTELKGDVYRGIGKTTMMWGIAQIEGNQKTKFYAHQKGKGKSGQKLPKRQMIGFQNEDANKLRTSMAKFIFNLIG